MDKKTAEDEEARTHRADDAGSPQEQREVRRGEQGTSTGDPHDDSDPQTG
jgi:hypothetical protein